MTKYAENTKVSSEKSRQEIESTLVRYGATGFVYGWENGGAAIGFVISNRHVRFTLPLPDKASKEFTRTEHRGSQRTQEQALKAWEQACRQKWRALALAIKAKLECVDSGITTLEQEFMAHIVLPNGATISQWIEPQLAAAYSSGGMPKLLLGAAST